MHSSSSRKGERTDLIPEEPPHDSVQQLLPLERAEPNFAGDVRSENYHVLGVHCHGSRGMWSIDDSTTFSYESVLSRVKMQKEGNCTANAIAM